ncbi:pilus motility taxis protein HmpF [Mastigocladopsis repens]|uniref:pilus motility taxis protein HmpF n=1 Tax=Mastigocladopsis repens TaxID=221287 RepID=UPI0002FA72AE|nr:pilus motility taxis protein HmpF [Mastigocladopsis repens]
MLYLAEVQKQKGGLLGGGGKTELKLLACQRTDQSWGTVSEEVIAAEEASKLSDGILVLVEMNPNRQVQRIQEAGRPLVNILQNFSRQVEKFKVKEEEIDQWKQSLTFQAQELNRREMDMETRLEQLQQKEDEVQRLETQQQQVEVSRQEIEKLRMEIERNRQELEGAWGHLRGEQRRLEEYKAECQQQAVLDEEQSRVLNELLARLSTSVAPTQTVREHLDLALEMVERQQAVLNPHWQQLEQQKTAVDQQQVEVNRLSQELSERQKEWQQAQNSLEQQIAELKVNTVTLERKQEYARILKDQLRHHQELHQKLRSFSATVDVTPTCKVDVAALENMPLEQLQNIVRELQQKLSIDSSFVHEQEQELTEKQKNIEELQQKINQGSELERGYLEAELVDEKDLYQMLNETLVGQRRSLLEQQDIFKQHQTVLQQREGKSLVNEQEETNIDLKAILLQIEMQQQQQSQELQNLEHEISQMHTSIEQMQGVIAEQTQQQQTQRDSLQTMEQNLFVLQTTTAESRGRLNLYQEALQPIQYSVDEVRQKLQGMTESLARVQETGDYQLQAIAQMRQTLLSLMSQPQLTAS